MSSDTKKIKIMAKITKQIDKMALGHSQAIKEAHAKALAKINQSFSEVEKSIKS